MKFKVFRYFDGNLARAVKFPQLFSIEIEQNGGESDVFGYLKGRKQLHITLVKFSPSPFASNVSKSLTPVFILG
jgi:hypothetical protein